MSVQIHSQALVSERAFLSCGVEVGAFSIIEDEVKIGENTKIGPNCFVTGATTIGKSCRIFKGAVVGSPPQDLKYKGEKTYLEIGDNNVIREFVTINPGTEEDSKTIIGSNNLIMAYSHIAHNCKIGNNCILANGTTLAGYVTIEDRVVVGGLVAVHQFCRIGRFSIVGGCSKVVQDIPPYSLVDGHPAKVRGINLVGLKRANFSKETIDILHRAFKILFFKGHTLKSALEIVEKQIPLIPEVEELLQFLKDSKRGISR
ncbi:MAG: acyl-ACP--UDP-N-acetylglucosamine O-acyltransferase [Candidatus Omnitrophica bacterium]|nr:acyl-ACP--UDP-N-acetylglucosamine O-acyltransferase [Candidatus Omnitrophota bacterium]